MDEIGDWFTNLPSCTKFLLSNVVLITLTFATHSPIIYELQKFQLWRHYSSFFLFPLSITGALQLFLLYYLSMEVETAKFSGVTADYFYYLLFIILTITIQSYIWPILLSQSLMMAIIYTWSLYRRRTIINLYNVISFKAVYLPFILLLLDTCVIQYISYDLLAGIIAGHLYFYLKERYPAAGGIRLLNTPRWLYGIFPNSYRSSNSPKSRIDVDFRLGFLGWDLFGLVNFLGLRDRGFGSFRYRNERWRSF